MAAASSYLVSSDYNNNIRLLIPGPATYLLLSLLSGDTPKFSLGETFFRVMAAGAWEHQTKGWDSK